MRVRYSSITLFLLFAASAAVLEGCTPAPKYRGHGRRRSTPSPHTEDVRRPIPPLDVAFSTPVKHFSRSRITSRFGLRSSTRYRTQEFHYGIDIKAMEGEEALAAAPGTVTFAGRQRGFGNLVVIDHGNRISTAYAHLSRLSVRKGDWVARGTTVGRIGRTGNATSVHLHFEIRSAGKALDPLDYL